MWRTYLEDGLWSQIHPSWPGPFLTKQPSDNGWPPRHLQLPRGSLRHGWIQWTGGQGGGLLWIRWKQRRMLPAGKRRGRQLFQQSGTRGCVPSTGRCQRETGQETSNPPIRLGMLPILLPDWMGEGKSPSMWGNQDANIMRDRPIFSWTENRTTHRSPMNTTIKKRIDLQVARQQLKTQTGSTANFLIREDNSRDLLGKFHKDRSVSIRARRRVLQCFSHQFPCALQLQKWGILKKVKCRLCEKYYYKENKIGDPPDSVESVGHIQCYCPVLPLPRIAMHHGKWRELMFSIRKSST